jgi:hypothetical protein
MLVEMIQRIGRDARGTSLETGQGVGTEPQRQGRQRACALRQQIEE